MKPDVFLSWPRNTDYPLWRQMIHENRERYNEIIIAFTETYHGSDYRQFVRDAMFKDHILFVEAPLPKDGEDWRHVAVTFALQHSLHSEWLLFTEQDFFPLNGFWEEVEGAEQNGADFICISEGQRIHPACIFIKRELFNKTRKYFGIKPDVADHFYMIQEDIERMGEQGQTIKTHEILRYNYNHMAGLSHNMRLMADGGQPNHRIDQFREYITKCLQVTVPIDEGFKTLCENWLKSSL